MRYVKQATRNTPEIAINLIKGEIELRGRSSPENSQKFYAPLLRALQSDKMNATHVNVDVCLEYFNTSSSKCLYDIFRQLKRMKKCGTAINVNWYYEAHDEDMLEAGEDYDDIVQLDFKFIEHQNEYL
ncbi:MAG: DUF1987 domain-containing protein [Cyclobacteriaceae bacterium]